MAAANRECMDMLNVMRAGIKDVVRWQQAVLARLNDLAPASENAIVIDFIPDLMGQADANHFRQFVEASIAKLSDITE